MKLRKPVIYRDGIKNRVIRSAICLDKVEMADTTGSNLIWQMRKAVD